MVMQPDALLAETIENAFYSLDETTLRNIHDRWSKVLKLIVKQQGSNQLIEKWRKKDDNVHRRSGLWR